MTPSDRKPRSPKTLIDPSGHICGFFHNRNEALRTLLPFVREGLEKGEKAIHIIDGAYHDEHLRELSDAGADVYAAERSGQLEVLSWADTYLHGGVFDPDAALEMIDGFLSEARRQGYPRTRGIGDMQWFHENQLRLEDVLSYEARLNGLLKKHDDSIICAYDLSKFSGSGIVGALRAHPMSIVGGVLQQNPFYVPPEQIINELRLTSS